MGSGDIYAICHSRDMIDYYSVLIKTEKELQKLTFISLIINNYKHYLILLISIVFISDAPSYGQIGSENIDREASIYTIYNVEVDETSRNVTTSRDRALQKGQRQALEQLFRRIILISDREKLPSFTDPEVTEFISGFEINDERRSTVRYIASLVVHFNRSKINDILGFYQIPFAETLGTSVSVLPVLEEAGALRLWEKDNKWRLAWQDYDVINNLVPIETPKPSLKNRMYISALHAKNDDQKSIQSFIRENTLNDLIIATATVKKDVANGQLLLDINLKRNDPALEEENISKQINVAVPAYDENGEPNLDALYLAGVDAATDWVDDLWKSKVLVNYGFASKISASGHLNEISDWLLIQKQLEKVNLVRNINLKSITIDNIDLEIEFAGAPEQLALSLAQQGLWLEQEEGGQLWTIGLASTERRD